MKTMGDLILEELGGPLAPVHLTARALEWLSRDTYEPAGQKYTSPTGVAACARDPRFAEVPSVPVIRSHTFDRRLIQWADKQLEWCGVEDVRAIVGGKKLACFGVRPARELPVMLPSCPHCFLLFEEAMAETRQCLPSGLPPWKP